jgi:two-component system response regulator NreC
MGTTEKGSRVRILIADDHGVLRAGLRSLLNAEPDMEVVAEAPDGDQALDMALRLRPDIALADISMPGPSGIELAERLGRLMPELRVIILTMHEDGGLLQEALRAGASGYILKRAVESELIGAIRRVARGDRYLPEELQPVAERRLIPVAGAEQRPDDRLEDAEIKVLKLVAHGCTRAQLASALGTDPDSAEALRLQVGSKLGLHGRIDMIRYATQHGLMQD